MKCILILAGVSGSGKSTVGQRLAAELGWRFVEGDDFHPPANREKMRRGLPLDDADRDPWLEALAAHLAEARARGESVVCSCSALKRAYRDRLSAVGAGVVIILLEVPAALIRARVASRGGHFAGVDLVASQFAILEPLAPDEAGWRVDAAGTPAAVVVSIREALELR